MKINYTHLPVKVHYFFFLAAMGSIKLYVPVYGKQLGVSPLIMGSIIAILPIAYFIGKLILGYAADYFLAYRKAIFMALFTVTGICFVLMYYLPTLPGPILPEHQFQNVSCESLPPCDKNQHALAVASCNGTRDTTCHWVCENINFSMRLSFHSAEKEAIISSDTTCLLNVNDTSLCQRSVTVNSNCNVTCDNFEENQCLYTSITFWGFVILMFLGNVGYYISLGVNDTICFDILGKDGQIKYGRQMMWGTIGFSITTFLSGYTIDLWSQGKVYKTYTPAFILVLVFICIDLIYCYKKLKLPLTKSPNILKDVYAILKLVPIIAFLFTAIFIGIFEGLLMNFLFWYIEDLAMATGYMSEVKLIQGLTIFTGFLGSKAIFFFMSGTILRKFGYGYTVTFCFLCYAMRTGFLSLVPTPWHVILVEVILQGPSYALLYTTIVTYANVISPPGTSATVQALATGMKDGLAFLMCNVAIFIGYAIGGFLAGFLFKTVGSSMTFKIYSGLAGLSTLIYFIHYTSYLKHTTIDTPNNVAWRKPDVAWRQCDVSDVDGM